MIIMEELRNQNNKDHKMEDRNILLIFILYAISIFIELFAQCFTALIFFAKGFIRSDFYGLHVRFLKGKKTPVLDSSIFLLQKIFFTLVIFGVLLYQI